MNGRTKTADNMQALLDRARRYCALSEQCESGVRQKLIGWGAGGADVDAIVESLRADSYLDDVRYARAYCESKMLGQHWGRQKVVSQLRAKRLPKEAIDEGLATVSDEAYMAMLEDVAERRLATLASTDVDAASRKLVSFLLSRGFTMDEIKHVINKIETR